MAFSLIATAIFGGATLFGASVAGIAAGALRLGASLLLSYAKRPKPQAQTAIRGQVRVGAGIDCAILMGEDKVKGHLQYYAKWGAGNARNAYVKKLADGWCEGLAPYVYVFGARVDLIEQTPVGNEHARYTLDGWGNAIVLRVYDGRPGQLADSELVAATAGLDTPWLATSRGTNICYVVEDQTYDAEAFAQGLPEITYVLRGLREYDVRKDSTVSGGDGSHRLDDPSTWEYSQNNAVHRLNYLLGRRGVLSGEVMVGVGKEIEEIDVAMHMLASNVCDAERTVDGGTVATYHCNLWAAAGDDHLAVLKAIEDAMAGYAVNSSGLDGVLAGAPQIPVRTITSRDIRVDGEITIENSRSDGDGFNVLSGQYSAPETGYEPEGLKTVSVNADVVLDGGKRLAAMDFQQVSNKHIAQYLLNIRYRQNRKARRRLLPVSRELGLDVRIGEWLTVEDRDWLIVNWGFDKLFRMTLVLAETGADIYSEDGIEPGPVVLPKARPVNPSLISTVQNFNVAVGLMPGANGAQAPTLEFTWDPPGDPSITAVPIVYRQPGPDKPLMHATATDVEAGLLRVIEGVQSHLNYEARATITTVPDRLKTYTPWATTVTATQPLQIMLAEVAADIADRFRALKAEMDDVIAQTMLSSTSSQLAQVTAWSTVSKVGERVGNAEASITEERAFRVSENEALAAQQVTFAASLGDVENAIDITATAVDAMLVLVNNNGDDITSVAGRTTTLEATVNNPVTGVNATASGLSSTQSEVTVLDGVVTAISVDLSAVEATVNNPVTGVNATASGLSSTQADVTDLDGVVTAISVDLSAVEATVNNPVTGVNATASGLSSTQADVIDLDGVVTALSVDLTFVEAQAGNATAGGLMKWTASAGTGDVAVSFSNYMRASLGGGYIEAGEVGEIYNDGGTLKSRKIFKYDQTWFAKSDGTPVAVFGQSGSDLVLQNIRVGTVTFDQLNTANGKMVLKGYADFASIEVFS